MNQPSAQLLLLCLHEYLPRNDGVVAVFHINNALVFDARYREKIRGAGLLQKGLVI
jgi:hypothetical protein